MLSGVTESISFIYSGMLCLVFPSLGINSTGISLYTAFHRLTTWKLCLSSFSVSTPLGVTENISFIFIAIPRLGFPSPGRNSTGVSLYTAFHRLTTWKLSLSYFSVLATATSRAFFVIGVCFCVAIVIAAHKVPKT
ncbi:hypothetical protein T09_13030 [Trichinella sp. T9]|nr:hypothetical protein T09_13030 [Trichinella sp. T9]